VLLSQDLPSAFVVVRFAKDFSAEEIVSPVPTFCWPPKNHHRLSLEFPNPA